MKTISSILILLAFVLSPTVFGQETVETPAEKPDEVIADTSFTPEDLGTSKARILPGNPLYGFKQIARGTRNFFTFNPVSKAENQLRDANEKMAEAMQLVEEKGDEASKQRAAKIIEDASRDFETIAKSSDKLKEEKNDDQSRVNEFLDKIADYSLKQQVVMQKLQEQVPEESFAKIEEARRRHLEKFGEVMTKVADKERLAERLPEIIESQKGSNFKELKAMEILADLQDQVPPEAQEAIRTAQERVAKKFEERLSSVPQAQRQQMFSRMAQYAEAMPGNPVRQFEAFNQMKQAFQSTEMVTLMEGLKDKAVQKFESQFGQLEQAQSRENFMAPWTEGEPEDLRTIVEMETRLEPSKQAFQNFGQIKEEARRQFQSQFGNNLDSLGNNPTVQRMTSNPDLIDVRLVEEFNEALGVTNRPPEFLQRLENQTINRFAENAAAGNRTDLLQKVSADPQSVQILRELQQRLPEAAQFGINRALEAQSQIGDFQQQFKQFQQQQFQEQQLQKPPQPGQFPQPEQIQQRQQDGQKEDSQPIERPSGFQPSGPSGGEGQIKEFQQRQQQPGLQPELPQQQQPGFQQQFQPVQPGTFQQQPSGTQQGGLQQPSGFQQPSGGSQPSGGGAPPPPGSGF